MLFPNFVRNGSHQITKARIAFATLALLEVV
jgi:hypothetical protein